MPLLPSQPGRLSFQSIPCPRVSSAPFHTATASPKSRVLCIHRQGSPSSSETHSLMATVRFKSSWLHLSNQQFSGQLSGKGEYILHWKVCCVADRISFPSSLELKIRGLESALFLLQCHVLGSQHSSGAKKSFGAEMNGIYVFLGDNSQGGIWKNNITTNNLYQPSMGEQAK